MTTTPEERMTHTRATLRILYTLARPPKAPDDWDPTPERIVEMAYEFYRMVISEDEAAAALAEYPAGDVQLSFADAGRHAVAQHVPAAVEGEAPR